MTNKHITSNKIRPITSRLGLKAVLLGTAMAISIAMVSTPAMAQQAGTVNGHVTSGDGTALSGVTVEARSSVLPGVRTATSSANGRYQLPLLPPGAYELTFRNPDGTVLQRNALVLLQQKIKVDVAFGAARDEVVVVAQRINVDSGIASLKNTLGSDIVQGIPIGQEYRDLQKLIPGVQYSEDSVRGPSAGGSGQDNNYQFDGVDVSLPLFGTLSAEPSTHDIDQVSIVRGGATAIGFNRSGGFLINTISKRGTNEYKGEISYTVETPKLTSARDDAIALVDFEENRRWITANLGGPVIKDKLFLYGSYFRPTITRENASNAYGVVPDFKSERNEYFGKVTFAPFDGVLLDASYRTSDRTGTTENVGGFAAASTATSSTASQDIIIAEGSWVINDKSSLNFKFTDFLSKSTSRPDTIFNIPVTFGGALPIATIDQLGRFSVPQPLTATPPDVLTADQIAFNTFVQPFIDQYGFSENGVQTGGGVVGGANQFNRQDFNRTSFEIGYDRTINAGDTTHDIHIGYQYQEIGEDLERTSNGFGRISVLGGRSFADDGITPVFFEARVFQTGIVDGNGSTIVPRSIISSSKLQSFEINDTIENGDWTFNLGLLISNDVLFGQGLRENANNISGFELAPGNKYKMYEVDWVDMIQPRFGVNWDYSDSGSLYANFARYTPSASSLARAASWDRNLSRELRLRYDAAGNFIESSAVRSSSGKFFQAGLKPRQIKEYLVGWNKQVNDKLEVRLHARHRAGSNFWEDTNNNARTRFNAPAEIAALGDYIPNLAAVRAEIGGSSYVIAQLDTAHTEYYEAAIEADYTGDNFYLSGSYVWSSYTGNFDQDNTTTANDANSFIGSSFIADGAGRQLWDNREGKLRGDRPHQLKVYGYYNLPWNGSVGAFANYQSGQPWEAWDVEVYRALTGSRSDTSRFAEAAGSRRTKGHFQLDVSYAQELEVLDGYSIELRADLFNVLNSQTGYNIQNKVNSAGFGDPRTLYNPRRLQLSAKAKF
ncbi:MAG: carboxypeptidase regulatory-like domain-containing protein [Robiginitomaculum sp.]|nr:carboxypeptidase regulatory-like domain-containing protein [Robiginitomaculum sp.]